MSATIDQLAIAIADRYRLDREIGAGGMATVYLAHDLKHDRPVAVKVLHPELSAVLGADRFLAEIKTTAALQHPHILPLFDSGSANGLLFYVMPLIEGETLRGRLSREKQLPVADAIRLTKEVASALDYAHRRGIIHRDIKPENILLHEGQALVADFGIALAVQSAGGSRITQTGLSLGTPQYMSPEQAMGEREITARSDVYSLGAVAYEMLVGEAPFTGPTAQSIVAKVMTEDPPSIVRQRKSVPESVQAAIFTALQKLPADRFGTTPEFAAAMDVSTSGSRTAGRAASLGLPASRSRRVALTIGAVAALIAGFAAGRASSGSAPGASIQFTPKTFRDQAVFNARLAPDGQTIVYSAALEGAVPEMFVIRPDYPESRPLGMRETHLLSVSSKGELAVLVRARYMSFRLFRGTLARVPLGGGAPRELMEGIREADWSPDGEQLAVIHDIDGRDRLEFPLGTVLHQSSGYLSDPRVSRDGARVAFIEHPWRYDDRGTVNVVDLKGTRIVQTKEFGALQGMAWSADGRKILFSADEPGRGMVIHAVSLDGDLREAIASPGDNILHDIAPNGRWIVSQERRAVMVHAKGAGATEPTDQSFLDYSFRPVISGDGRLLAFGDASSTSTTLYSTLLRATTGGEAARLGDGYPLAFSPDGKWVASAIPTTPVRMVLYPTRTGAERLLDVRPLDQLTSADWFPDSRTLLLCGNESGKPSMCYVRAPEDGALRPVTPAGSTDGLVSPDGRLVVARDGSSGARVYSLTQNGDPPSPAIDSSEQVLGWSRVGRGLLVGTPNSLTIQRVDLATGRRETVVNDSLRNQAGIVGIGMPVLANDPRMYAFTIRRQTSRLFMVTGVR